MISDYQDMPVRAAGERMQKIIPKSGSPGPDSVQKTGELREEHGEKVRSHVFEGLPPAFQGRSQAEDVSEEPDVGDPRAPDEVRADGVPEGAAAEISYAVKVKNEDSFFEKLGREIHEAGSRKIWEPLSEEVIHELYQRIFEGLSKEKKRSISSLLEEQVVTALSHIPSYLLAEKVPPLSESFISVSQKSQAAGVTEESAAMESEISDEVRAEDMKFFLGELGREIHEAGSRKIQELMSEEVIRELYHRIYAGLSEEEKQGISSLPGEQVVTALSHIPSYLLAEEDPDHPGEIPDIKELLALDAYLQKYEQTNPEGNKTYSGYHRGGSGQPDFVYRNEREKTLKSYDPLGLPREEKMPEEDSEEKWLNDAFEKHASGKGTGAVCILDVSDAADEKLIFWTKKFADIMKERKRAIQKAILFGDDDTKINQREKLMHLCNTYVVSYGENANRKPVKALQRVFEKERRYLQKRPDLQQLESWREEQHSEPMGVSDIFDEEY